MDQIFDNRVAAEAQRGALRTQIVAHYVDTYDDGTVEEVHEIVRDVDHLEAARAQPQAQVVPYIAPHEVRVLNRDAAGRPAAPHLSACGCLEVPATPVTLPWLVPQAPGLSRATVEAVGLIHKTHTRERMLQMAPYLEGRCEAYGTTPADVAMTLMALHNVHVGGSKPANITLGMRNKALSVALAMYGATGVMEPQAAIDKARGQSWTRTIDFAQEFGLTSLIGLGVTSSLGCATYMAGVWTGAQVAKMKLAATGGGKVAALAATTGGIVGTSVLGVGTAGVAIGTVAWYYNVIQAYRDVWDNDFSRDAFFFHKMRDHHVLPDDDRHVHCYHPNNGWSSVTSRSMVGRRNIRWN